MKITDPIHTGKTVYQLWEWALSLLFIEYLLYRIIALFRRDTLSVLIKVSIFLGCGSILTIVLEMVWCPHCLWFDCCNEAGTKLLGNMDLTVTRLESTDNFHNVCSTGTSHWCIQCGIQLMLFAWLIFLWSPEKNKHETKPLHTSLRFRSMFSLPLSFTVHYHLLMYPVGSIFHIFWSGIVIVQLS